MSRPPSKKDRLLRRKRVILHTITLILLSIISYKIYGYARDLTQTIQFLNKAVLAEGVVIDVRQSAHDDFVTMLPSGKLATSSESYYVPIVQFTPKDCPPLVRELPDISAYDYELGQVVPLAILSTEKEGQLTHSVREHHDHFLWGAFAIKLGICLLFIPTLYFIWKRLRLRWSPKKPARKKAAAKKTAAKKKTPAKKSSPRKGAEPVATTGDSTEGAAAPEPH